VILDRDVGNLAEPFTGRAWPAASIPERCRRRRAYYASRGLRAGERVFLHSGNSLEFFVDVLALWSLGGCVVPIDPRLTPFEVDTLAGAAAPRFSLWRGAPDGAIAAPLSARGIEILESPDDEPTGAVAPSADGSALTLDADALVLFTSGTTGQPKGVVHTHRSLRARWMSLRSRLDLADFRRTLCLLPTHFGHGLICNALFPWLSGQDLVVVPPFKTDLIPQLGSFLDAERITFMSSVPTLWRLALKTARPPKSGALRRVFCGSAPLSAALWRGIQEWAGPSAVSNVYGITETGSWLAGTAGSDCVPEDGLVGEPWGGVIAVLRPPAAGGEPIPGPACAPGEPGHVWVNTPALMRGYLGRDDLTGRVVRGGWFATGDIGALDERGRLHLRGREREEINRGGAKVYPEDIDSVVERFDGALDVCTFGYDDPAGGEEVAVAVVLRSRDDDTLGRLHAWLRHHVAAHQMPRRWYVLEALPRTSRGKLNRAEVAALCARAAPVDPRRLPRGGPGETTPGRAADSVASGGGNPPGC
jgi:acyl-CoA synthetase (AMP-forming)/AMP-acid ligase II